MTAIKMVPDHNEQRLMQNRAHTVKTLKISSFWTSLHKAKRQK